MSINFKVPARYPSTGPLVFRVEAGASLVDVASVTPTEVTVHGESCASTWAYPAFRAWLAWAMQENASRPWRVRLAYWKGTSFYTSDSSFRFEAPKGVLEIGVDGVTWAPAQEEARALSPGMGADFLDSWIQEALASYTASKISYEEQTALERGEAFGVVEG